jgi:hypothetical protein
LAQGDLRGCCQGSTPIVEWVGRLPGFDWITVVIAKLPDELTGAGQVLISVNAHSQTSSQVSVAISP